MGVSSASFVDTYYAKVTDLMVKLVEYIQSLDNRLSPPEQNRTGTETGTAVIIGNGTGNNISPMSSPSTLILEKSPKGYPILPDPIPSERWKKTQWEILFSDYIRQQYHLALGGKNHAVPYKRIAEKQLDFIEPKYLPRKTIFKSPRNTTLDEIKSILDFFLKRQRDHGPEEAFRFKAIKLKGITVATEYEEKSSSDPTSDSCPARITADKSIPGPPTGAGSNADSGAGPTTSLGGANSRLNSDSPGPDISNSQNINNNLVPPRPRPITRSKKN
jgi:hypothetical protein